MSNEKFLITQKMEPPLEMGTLPSEVLYEILLNLEPESIIRLCRTATYFQRDICQSEFGRLWTLLYERDISFPVPENARERYFQIMSEIENGARQQEDKLGYKIKMAAANNYRILLSRLLDKTTNIDHYTTALIAADTNEHHDIFRDIFERLYENPGSLIEVVRHLIKDNHTLEADYLLREIARVGDVDLLDELLPNVNPSNDKFIGHRNIAFVLYGAAEGGRIDLINKYLSRDSDTRDLLYLSDLYREILKGAGEGGHFEIIRNFRTIPGLLSVRERILNALTGMARGNHLGLVGDLFDLAREKGYTIEPEDLKSEMFVSAENGHFDSVKLMMNLVLAANLKQPVKASELGLYDYYVQKTQNRGYTDIANYLKEHRPPLLK